MSHKVNTSLDLFFARFLLEFQLKFFYRGLIIFPLKVLRVQSPDGTKRIEVSPTDSTLRLYEAVRDAFSLPGYLFALYKERGRKQEVVSSRSRAIASSGFSHGDLIYMAPINGGVIHSQPSTSGGVIQPQPGSSKGSNGAATAPSTPTTSQGTWLSN